jgi:hypothetical protein
MKLFAWLAALLLLGGSAAQESAPRECPGHALCIFANGIEILLVAENPFSARYSIESSRNFDDGSVPTMHLETNVARDSQGRIYREHRSADPNNATEQSELTNIFILDPVAHTQTSCNVAARHCTVRRYHGRSFLKPPPDGSLDPGVHFVTRTNLGNDIIEGLSVVGTRETVSDRGGWPEEKWQVSTREFWYSPDLGINLSATSKLPTEGTRAIRVIDLSRSEPDPALFQIPANFTVEDRQRPATSAK